MRRDVRIARIAFAYLRLAYLNALYFGVGLTQEGYCRSKGNIWLSIGHVDRAIRCYRNSLKVDESAQVRALLGWCYGCMGDNNAALENYRLAYAARPLPDIALGLASLEFYAGDKETALTVLRRVQEVRNGLDAELLMELEHLEKEYGIGATV